MPFTFQIQDTTLNQISLSLPYARQPPAHNQNSCYFFPYHRVNIIFQEFAHWQIKMSIEFVEVDIKYPIHIGPVFPCKMCKTNFINLFFLQKHYIKCIHVQVNSLQKNNFFMKNQEEKQKNKIINCKFCNEKFHTPEKLEDHLQVHSDKKPYECDICYKQFSFPSHHKRHLRTHTGEKPYKCDICHKHFSDTSSHKRHIRIHSGEKPYECDICKKQFSDSSVLKKHMRTHSGERPYKCDVCYKQFFQSFNLKKHLIIHTGEKPFHCDICNKHFPYKSSYKIHLRTHSVLNT